MWINRTQRFALLSLLIITLSRTGTAVTSCKCNPGDTCWPSPATWDALNASVSGQLIVNTPPAAVCYPGPQQDVQACAYVAAQWSNATFQSNRPVGLSYPITVSCPPVNTSAGETQESCSIGDLPRYTVNATRAEHIAAGILFAQKYKIRLVIKDTGHDLLGRSNGFGSLELWIRYLRTGIVYQKNYKPSYSCSKLSWKGSAFTIGGGYTWEDVYPEAKSRDLIVVGGGTPTVGCLGGWMQGGGHGPASHDFGLGADQVLEATVVLANGSIVTANSCQNQDLFFAIRGGGGGTYGVVVSTIIKAWPTTNVVTQNLAIAPLADDTSALVDVVALIWSAYPDLNDAGFSGYGTWTIASPTPIFGNFTSSFVHGISMFGKSIEDAQRAFFPVAEKLKKYNGSSLFVSLTYALYPTYATFYEAESGIEPPVGTAGALGSRLFDRAALTKNPVGLRRMLNTVAGAPEEYTSNNFELVGGGQVFKDANDPYSGLHPAWRTSYMSNIVARGWASDANAATIDAVHKDITYNKLAAMKVQAPDTGCYMNEADRLDPEYQQDFYGTHFSRLSSIKQQYDPQMVFYCPTCIGSELWRELPSGSGHLESYGYSYTITQQSIDFPTSVLLNRCKAQK